MIPYSEPNLTALEHQYVSEALTSGWVGGHGDFIDRFEAAFAKYIGVKYAVTCSSGTAALQLAYITCGMGNQPTGIPQNTFAATVNMARLLTPQITLLEADSETYNIRLGDYRDSTGFTVAVHLYGNPCDMGQVYRWKGTLIEDCAQALGSEWRWKKCGSFGRASTFSFHSAKTITTGEGGMVCTDDEKVASGVRHLKNQAMIAPYEHRGLGFNYRMTNIQAALGLAQLQRIDGLVAAKRAITEFYDTGLDKSFVRQKQVRWAKPCKWANTYRHPRASHIRRELASAGIETRPGFVGDDFISFPCSTKLTKPQLEEVVKAANAAA